MKKKKRDEETLVTSRRKLMKIQTSSFSLHSYTAGTEHVNITLKVASTKFTLCEIIM